MNGEKYLGWKTRKIMKVSTIQKKRKEIEDIFKLTEELHQENISNPTKVSFKNKQFREDMQKSLKKKKNEIKNIHNEYFLNGNWMNEDTLRMPSIRNTSHDERSPEEIPEEEYDSNKPLIKHIQAKQSFNEIKTLNAYEMRESMPINPQKNNNYIDEKNEESQNLKKVPKFGFLKKKKKGANIKKDVKQE